MSGSGGGRDLDFGFATSKSHCGQKRGRDMKLMSRHRVIFRRIATWIVMSRPRPSAVGQFGIATWSFEVATWGRLPGRVATSARPASARPALAGHATCARSACCVRSSAHDLGTARAVCGRPGFWCAHCTHNPVLWQCTV